MYQTVPIISWLAGKEVVYLDGLLFHVQPTALSPEEQEYRQRRIVEFETVHLSAPRGSYNTIQIDKSSVIIHWFGTTGEVPFDYPVKVWRDIAWDRLLPGDKKLSLYSNPARRRLVVRGQFIEKLFLKSTYCTLDGHVVRGLERQALAAEKRPDEDATVQRILLAQPDRILFFNQVDEIGYPVTDDTRLFMSGARWAFTKHDNHSFAVKSPGVEAPSISF